MPARRPDGVFHSLARIIEPYAELAERFGGDAITLSQQAE